MTWHERIVIDPEVLVRKPVIRGTRLAVEFIVDLPAEGWSEEEILRNFPGGEFSRYFTFLNAHWYKTTTAFAERKSGLKRSRTQCRMPYLKLGEQKPCRNPVYSL